MQKKAKSKENSQSFNWYEYFIEWQTVHKWGDLKLKIVGRSAQQLQLTLESVNEEVHFFFVLWLVTRKFYIPFHCRSLLFWSWLAGKLKVTLTWRKLTFCLRSGSAFGEIRTVLNFGYMTVIVWSRDIFKPWPPFWPTFDSRYGLSRQKKKKKNLQSITVTQMRYYESESL